MPTRGNPCGFVIDANTKPSSGVTFRMHKVARRSRPLRRVALLSLLSLVAAACGSTETTASAEEVTAAASAEAPTADVSSEWETVLATADGQTVQIHMWGGDTVLNSYIEDTVAPIVAEQGVILEQVRLEATSDGLNRIISEFEAGSTDGAVDLIWVNGINFAQGKDAGLWADDWVSELPNAALLNVDDPTLFNDFGVPTDGQEAPWSRAAFTFAFDSTVVDNPPTTFEELGAWVTANPGRFTYPAPPDFTGSAFVRQAVQALGEDAAFALLAEMEPNLFNGGQHPVDEAELNTLFGNGQVDIAMSYNPNFVQVNVGQGIFSAETRPYIFESGTLQNVSFLAMPANAGSPEGARVVMNALLSAELQAEKLNQVGVPAVVDIGDVAEEFELRLTDFGTPLEELPADQVPALDERWRTEILG